MAAVTGMEHAIEQVAEVLNIEGACCGECCRAAGDPLSECPACEQILTGYARALAEAGLITPAPLHVELRDSGDLGLTPGAFTQHRYATAWDDGYNAGKNDLRDGHVFRTRNPHREADQ